MGRAVDAQNQVVQGCEALCLVFGAAGNLGLDFERGERGAQFVRGIGSETPLAFQRRDPAGLAGH